MATSASLTTFNIMDSGIRELLQFASESAKEEVSFAINLSDEVENHSKHPFIFHIWAHEYMLDTFHHKKHTGMTPAMKETMLGLLNKFIQWLTENIDSILASDESLLSMTKIVVVLSQQFNQYTQNTDILLLLSRALRYITRHNKTNSFVNSAVVEILRNHYNNPQILFELVCCSRNIIYSLGDITMLYDEYIEFLMKGFETHQDNQLLEREILNVFYMIMMKVQQLESKDSTYIRKKIRIYNLFFQTEILDLAFKRINLYCGSNNELIKSYLLLIFKLVNNTERILSHYAAQHDYFQMMKKLIDTYDDASMISFHIRKLALDIIASLGSDKENYPEYCETFSCDYFVSLACRSGHDLATQYAISDIFAHLSVNRGTKIYTESFSIKQKISVNDSEDYYDPTVLKILKSMILPSNDCELGINLDRFLLWLMMLNPFSDFEIYPGLALKEIDNFPIVERSSVMPQYQEIGSFLLEFLNTPDKQLRKAFVYAIANMSSLYPEVFECVKKTGFIQLMVDMWSTTPESAPRTKRQLAISFIKFYRVFLNNLQPDDVVQMVKSLETNPGMIRYIMCIANIPKYHQLLLDNMIIHSLVQLLNNSEVIDEDLFLCLLLLANNFDFTVDPFTARMYGRYCSINKYNLKFHPLNVYTHLHLEVFDYALLKGMELFSQNKIDTSAFKYYIPYGSEPIRIMKMLIYCGVKILPGAHSVFKNQENAKLLPLYQSIQTYISREFSTLVRECESDEKNDSGSSGRLSSMGQSPPMRQLLKSFVTGYLD